METFSDNNELDLFATNFRKLAKRYMLVMARDGRRLREKVSLEVAGVQNYGEKVVKEKERLNMAGFMIG